MIRRTILAVAAGAFLMACGGPSSAPRRAPLPFLHELRSKEPMPLKIERVAIAPASASRVGFAHLAKYTEPGLNVPRQPKHAPDGRSVTFLASEHGDETMSLYAFDVVTGK